MANVQIAYEYAEIELEDGEVICPECKGDGVVRAWNVAYTSMRTVTCLRCFGTKKLDWIDMIVGKDEPQVSSSKSSQSSSSTNKKRRI